MQSIKTYIISGITGIFLIRILGIGLALLNSVILARTMGPDEYGLYSFAIEMMMFISIPVALGLPSLLTREVSKYNQQGRYDLINGIIRWSSIFVFVVGIFIMIVIVIILVVSQRERTVLYAFLFATPIILLRGLGQVRMGSLRGLKRIIQSQIPDTLIGPTLVLAIISLFYWKFDLLINAQLGILVNVFALFIAFIIGIIWLFKALPNEHNYIKTNKMEKEWFREALPFFMLGSVALINAKLSIILVGFFRPAAEVGIYKIAIVASTIVSFLLNAVNMTIGPLVSEMYFSERYKQLQRVLTITVRYIFGIGVIISMIYFFFGKYFINLFYGKDYIQAYWPLIILTVGQLINSGAGSVGIVLSMTGHQRDSIKGQVVAALVNISINILFVPIYGIIGAAIATSASLLVWNLIMVHTLKEKLGLKTSII